MVFHATLHTTTDANASLSPLAVSFDEAAERLAQLPRMYFEPDGSFVWVSAPDDSPRWQLDGQLYDRGDVLDYVELKGTCAVAEFGLFLAALRGDAKAFLFQLAREGVRLDEAAALNLLRP